MICYTIDEYLKASNQTYLVGISSREKFEENGYLYYDKKRYAWCSCNDEETKIGVEMGINVCIECAKKRGFFRKQKLERILK